MIVLSPPAAQLLADLAEHGIHLETRGNAIRFRPVAAMTPPLLERLREHKAELLTWTDLDHLRRSIHRLWKDPAWVAAWERRLLAIKDANLETLRRVLTVAFDVVHEYHERRDWRAFDAARRYLHALASGEEWDRAARKAVDLVPGQDCGKSVESSNCRH
jgi:hypothetical protein